MAFYYIRNFYYWKYLSLSASSTTNHGTLCLLSDTAGLRSTWDTTIGTEMFVRTSVDVSYGLNVYRSGSPYACDIFPVSGNETDAAVNFLFNSVTSSYAIKLSNYNLYLTADSDGSVYWTTFSNNNQQMWQLILNDTAGKALDMTQNINQRYYNNDQIIKDVGCCVCCACDVASHYAGSHYTLSDMYRARVYTYNNGNCNFPNVPSATFSDPYTQTNQSGYLSKIKSEINANRPVLVHFRGTREHWVVAYGYFGDGTANTKILVLDPYGYNTSSLNGRRITLAEAINIQGGGSIVELRITNRK